MRSPHGLAALQTIRAQPLWRLLASDNAPVVIALLQDLLLEGDKTLAASVLVERLGRALDDVRAHGEAMPQTPQGYLADWRTQGLLVRRLPAGASEEQYELSGDAVHAIRFVTGLRERRVLATESRLSTVMRQLVKLAEETDPNPDTRVVALMAERDRIDREIHSVRTGGVKALGDERALERAREIIALADELAADFRRVRDDFDRLNRGLRQKLMEDDGSRGEVLESLFAGVDLISDSDAGKTFAAFWSLLTDPEQSEQFRDALDALSQRAFARKLLPRERKFLSNLTALLADEGNGVHDVLQSFARSLKSFVQSREFLEQRRLHALLKQATQAALAARALVKPTEEIDYDLPLSSSRLRSVSQCSLYDPAEHVSDAQMHGAEPADLDLAVVSELVRQSEIDFRSLRESVLALLGERDVVTIAHVLARFPAQQGLGSVVGYVALGAKHGEVHAHARETVSWTGDDHVRRAATIPLISFARERYHELID